MTEIQSRILVVDDDQLNRIKLSRGLETQGHQVVLAEDGLQALELIQRSYLGCLRSLLQNLKWEVQD